MFNILRCFTRTPKNICARYIARSHAASSLNKQRRLYNSNVAVQNMNDNAHAVPHYSFQLKSYNSDQIRNHLRKRRIITNEYDNPSNVLQNTINNLCEVEFINQNNWNLSPHDITSFQNELSYAIDSKLLGFGTPLLTNLGQPEKPSLAPMACTVLNLPKENTVSDLMDHIQPSAMKGQGLGFDLTKFEDPIAMLNTLNDIFLRIDANCVRTVAGMATLESSHPKVMDFIKSKKEYDFMKGRFNISIKLKKNDLNNKLLMKEISKSIHYCGEPGVLFIDQLEYDNPIQHMPYLSTAPCAELAMSEGDGCHFAYLNLSRFIHEQRTSNPKFSILDKIDWELLEQMIRIATRMLDNAVEISAILEQESVLLKRRIGVGICGFSDLLLKLNIPYDSHDAKLLSSEIMNVINFVSKMASIELSKHRGAFDCYKQSKYYETEAWLKRNQSTHDQNTKIGCNEWNMYYDEIKKYGIRNATTTALPPSGNAALILNASQSVEPYFNLLDIWNHNQISSKVETYLHNQAKMDNDIDVEHIKNVIIENKGILPSNAENIPDYIKRTLKCATQISPECHIDIVSSFQKHLDDSVSKTINLPSQCDYVYIEELISKSFHCGLKGVTFFRNECLQERNVKQ